VVTQASLLQHIHNAKKAHLHWVKRARHLVEGLPINKDFIPLEGTSCHFGKWFYTEGMYLKNIESTRKLIQEIEIEHDKLHESYKNIYKIFFIIPEQKSLLQKFFLFNYHSISKNEQEKAKIYFKYLKRTSEELVDTLTHLEEKIKHLNHHELKKLSH
jgi:hypothetical protein